MRRNDDIAIRGAIRLGQLLSLGIAALVMLIVGVIGFTANKEVKHIFDRSAHDSRALATDTVSRFAQLLASTTAVTVRPAVLDHNYSYVRDVLGDMTQRDASLLYIAVYDETGTVVEQSGARPTTAASSMTVQAPITSQGQGVGEVELVYSTAGVDQLIRAAQADNEVRESASFRNLLLGGTVVLGFGLVIAAVVGVWLSRPVTRMAQAANKLGAGSFDVRVDVGGPQELRQLATTFNSMAGELEASIEASIEQAALEREVATARRLQQQMMPAERNLSVGGLEIASWYAPAGKMGGDWWAATESSDGRAVTLMIGDVIGHGIPAALFTAAAKSAYQTTGILRASGSPHEILSTIDRALRGFSQTHTMSCCAARLDLDNQELVLSLGAHPPPLRLRANGATPTLDVLEGEGPLLGDPMPGPEFTSSHHALESGDVYVLFTDGIIEAANASGRMFGLRRLGASIRDHLDRDLDQILEALKQDFYTYVAEREVEDDVTVVLVRYLPQTGSRAAS